MKATDLRQKSVDELKKELVDLLKQQFNLRMKKATGQLTQTHLIGQVRKNIARVKTVIAQKMGEANV